MSEYIRSERPILSISMMTPGEKPTLERCMQSLDHLRQTIPCEFVITDTGCDAEHRAMIERYADRIIDFTWINDFAAARNAGLDVCTGEWVLIWDDDEVMFDPEEMEEFFLSGEYKRWHQCGMSAKNYYDWDEREYKLSSTLRPVELTPETRYHGKIHENLGGLQGENYKFLKTHLGHYGYIFANEEEQVAHCKRNMEPMMEELQHNPGNLHLVSQLTQELRMAKEWETLERISKGYYALAKEHNEAMGLSRLGMFASAWVDSLYHSERCEAAQEVLRDTIADKQVSELDRTALYAYGVWNSYVLRDWNQAIAWGYKYTEYFHRFVDDFYDYVNRFFVDDMYTPKCAQITFFYALMAAYHSQDSDAAAFFEKEIPWEDPKAKLQDDFAKALCEDIRNDNPLPELRQKIKQLLEMERFRDFVLQQVVVELNCDPSFLLHLYPYIEDVSTPRDLVMQLQLEGAVAYDLPYEQLLFRIQNMLNVARGSEVRSELLEGIKPTLQILETFIDSMETGDYRTALGSLEQGIRQQTRYTELFLRLAHGYGASFQV